MKYLRSLVKKTFNKSLRKRSASSTAFSLLELSIVLLIIGVLISATVSAKAIMKNARLKAAQSKTRAAPVNSIPDAVIWLESSLESSFAAAEAEDGVALSGWNDIKTASSAPINNAAAGTSNPVFSNTINSIQAVKFAGNANSYFEIDGSALNNSDYTIIFLEKRQGSGANYFLSDDGTSTEDDQTIQLGYAASGSVIHSQGSGNEYRSAIAEYEPSSEKPNIFTFIQNASTGKKTYINGYLTGENTANTTQLTGIDKLHLGKNYTGEIGEFLIFDRALKGEERRSIEKYLQEKWRININMISTTSAKCSNGAFITSSGICDDTNEDCVSLPSSMTGVSTMPSYVMAGSDSIDCDETGYSGAVNYTCIAGNFTATSSCTLPPMTCSGGTKSCVGGGSLPSCTGGKVIHVFTASDTFSCTTGDSIANLEYLGVGAGGDGGLAKVLGVNQRWAGGGGGGGEVVYSSGNSLVANDSVSVVVGDDIPSTIKGTLGGVVVDLSFHKGGNGGAGSNGSGYQGEDGGRAGGGGGGGCRSGAGGCLGGTGVTNGTSGIMAEIANGGRGGANNLTGGISSSITGTTLTYGRAGNGGWGNGDQGTSNTTYGSGGGGGGSGAGADRNGVQGIPGVVIFSYSY